MESIQTRSSVKNQKNFQTMCVMNSYSTSYTGDSEYNNWGVDSLKWRLDDGKYDLLENVVDKIQHHIQKIIYYN